MIRIEIAGRAHGDGQCLFGMFAGIAPAGIQPVQQGGQALALFGIIDLTGQAVERVFQETMIDLRKADYKKLGVAGARVENGLVLVVTHGRDAIERAVEEVAGIGSLFNELDAAGCYALGIQPPVHAMLIAQIPDADTAPGQVGGIRDAGIAPADEHSAWLMQDLGKIDNIGAVEPR